MFGGIWAWYHRLISKIPINTDEAPDDDECSQTTVISDMSPTRTPRSTTKRIIIIIRSTKHVNVLCYEKYALRNTLM